MLSGLRPSTPESVEELIEDLCAFANTDDLPPVAQAAIAHAQFETIHPFVDGNGRTGRAIIHLVLRRRGLAPRILPPVSLVLATLAKDYVGGLTATRYLGLPSSPEATTGVNTWHDLCERVHPLGRRCGHIRVTRRRAGGAVAQALGPGARELRDRPPACPAAGRPRAHRRERGGAARPDVKPANDAIQRLVDAGILRQITIGRRNRAYEAPEIIEAFADLERQLASPAGDTPTSSTARVVPRRRPRAKKK